MPRRDDLVVVTAALAALRSTKVVFVVIPIAVYAPAIQTRCVFPDPVPDAGIGS